MIRKPVVDSSIQYSGYNLGPVRIFVEERGGTLTRTNNRELLRCGSSRDFFVNEKDWVVFENGELSVMSDLRYNFLFKEPSPPFFSREDGRVFMQWPDGVKELPISRELMSDIVARMNVLAEVEKLFYSGDSYTVEDMEKILKKGPYGLEPAPW
jgi:hypothetical protein